MHPARAGGHVYLQRHRPAESSQFGTRRPTNRFNSKRRLIASQTRSPDFCYFTSRSHRAASPLAGDDLCRSREHALFGITKQRPLRIVNLKPRAVRLHSHSTSSRPLARSANA